MADTVSKEQRSRNMASIKSSGNRSTEIALISLFRQNKITGCKRHVKIFGRPDFVFPKKKIAVFVDGCFWHGCTRCNLKSKSNIEYWDNKISRNKKRDHLTKLELEKAMWTVIRVWEHQMKKDNSKVCNKIAESIKKQK